MKSQSVYKNTFAALYHHHTPATVDDDDETRLYSFRRVASSYFGDFSRVAFSLNHFF
jgi:hypothetical protein